MKLALDVVLIHRELTQPDNENDSYGGLLAMRTGTVKWFCRNKGYGLIRPDEGSEDIFVFYPSIEAEGFKSLTTGQNVSFECAQAESGWHTTRVVPN